MTVCGQKSLRVCVCLFVHAYIFNTMGKKPVAKQQANNQLRVEEKREIQY